MRAFACASLHAGRRSLPHGATDPPAKCVCSRAYMQLSCQVDANTMAYSGSIRRRLGRRGALYYAVLRDVCSRAYAPVAAESGFSKIVGTSSGAGYAARRRAGGACHGSAASRRQTNTSRSGNVGSAYARPGGICADRTLLASPFAVDKCAGAVAASGWAERKHEVSGRLGAGSVRSRSDACPDLPSLTAGRALAMRARHYMPRSRSTDFGLGSIDFSAAASRPRPRACPRPRSLLPDSRPPR